MNEVCVQCEANARWNEAGGYKELAEECRAYCRRGHKQAAANSVPEDSEGEGVEDDG